MGLVPGLCWVAGIAALGEIERKSAVQGMLARPLVLAPLLGWLLGHPAAGLALAAPLELLWLGGLNIGANLPDNEVVGTVAVVGAACLAAGPTTVSPGLALAALVVLAPLSILGRVADERVERFHVRLADRAMRRAEAGIDDPARVALLGVVAPAAAGLVLGTAGAGAGAVLLPRLLAVLPHSVAGALPLGWLAVAGACAASAVAAIRAPRAPLAAGLAVGAGLLVLLGLVFLVPGAAG